MPFDFRRLTIPDVILIEPQIFRDERGYFLESYKRTEFESFGICENFVQDNHSNSKKGVIRGLHFQNHPEAQGKLIRVIRGEIYDVAVDIRLGSPTYGKWIGEKLSAENGRMLYIPPGFAHGFCVLSDNSDVLYKATKEYAPEEDGGIIWNDPAIKVKWPITKPVLSQKDAELPLLSDADINFVYQNL